MRVETSGTGLARRQSPATSWRSTALGGFYLAMAGVNAGLVTADPTVYDRFAASSPLGFVRTGWADVVMAHPHTWVLLLAAGEAVLGTSLLVGGRAARLGWLAAIAFHVLLLLFGFGFWLYAVPALAVLVRGARREWSGAREGRPGGLRSHPAEKSA